MNHQEEYHDPDYPEASGHVKVEPKCVSENEKLEKIRSIVRREFAKELEARESEVKLIDQRMATSRRLLHRLRYSLVSGYYRDQKLQLSAAQVDDEVANQSEPRARAEASALLREGQRRLHPSVRKLLGRRTADLDEILFASRAPRQNARKDYCAMIQSRNYTIAADTTKTLRPGASTTLASTTLAAEPERPRKVPRHQQPKVERVLTLDEATRNQMKHRYRIVIGNTSKYAPGASRADRSTHKWLLYVRGVGDAAVCGPVLTAVTVRLHHSYAPHHTVHIDKPPFHVSRRGWGEFPAKVELHFAQPERNRPATVEHTIKLDRNYTGLQTLGSETIVDVWLYSTPEMTAHEYREETEPPIDNQDVTQPEASVKVEMDLKDMAETVVGISNDNENEIENEIENDQADNWLDFFSNTTELDVDEMFIKPAKKVERADLDSIIESSVIKKETPEQNHETNHSVEVPTINNEPSVDLSKVKTEIVDHWMPNVNANAKGEIVDLPNELLSQPTSPKKRIMKYMDPTTGKIYYLEMDRNLDLSKVQEIVINSKGNVKTAKISPIKPNGLKNVRKTAKKGGVSLLKPEVKSLLKKEETAKEKPAITQKPATQPKKEFTHIDNDHCYLGYDFTAFPPRATLPDGANSVASAKMEEVEIKKEKTLYECLCAALARFSSVRVAVNYLLKKVPLISSEARDPDFQKHFPFVVESEERYWKLDFAKRRNIEWSRAKLINKMATEHFRYPHETIWRTKQILIFSRLHGYYPIRTETIQRQTENTTNWSSWLDDNSANLESNIKSIYPLPTDICSLTKFDSDSYCQNLCDSIDIGDSDEEIEVVNCDFPPRPKREVLPDSTSDLEVLPVDNEEDRLRFLFIERKCADLGVELRNEDVGSGYSYSAVHAVLLSAVRSFAEEVVRGALADKLQRDRAALPMAPVWTGSSSWRAPINLEHVLHSTRRTRMAVVNGACLGTERKDHCAL